jgi:hypothetical protein
VYELDTLRLQARNGLEQLSLVILCSCANKSQTTPLEQCQVATESIWDGPNERSHALCSVGVETSSGGAHPCRCGVEPGDCSGLVRGAAWWSKLRDGLEGPRVRGPTTPCPTASVSSKGPLCPPFGGGLTISQLLDIQVVTRLIQNIRIRFKSEYNVFVILSLNDKADRERMIATATLSERSHLPQIAAQTSIYLHLVDE